MRASTVAPGLLAAVTLLASACGEQRGLETGAAVAGSPEAAPELPRKIEPRRFEGRPASARAGRVQFIQNNCYGCHGGQAGGSMGPSLRDGDWEHGGSDSAIAHSIREGHPDRGMPPFKNRLSERQVMELVSYIQSLRTPAEPTFFLEAWDDTMRVAGRAP